MSDVPVTPPPAEASISDDEATFLDGLIRIKTSTGYNYQFKMPSIMERVALDQRVRRIRASTDPMGRGDTMGLNQETAWTTWAFAAFEMLLREGGDADWARSPDPVTKMPIVDHTKFGDEWAEELMEVAEKLSVAMDRFRPKRPTRQSAGTKTDNAGGNTGA